MSKMKVFTFPGTIGLYYPYNLPRECVVLVLLKNDLKFYFIFNVLF